MYALRDCQITQDRKESQHYLLFLPKETIYNISPSIEYYIAISYHYTHFISTCI